MKKLRTATTSTLLGLTLLVGAGSAFAQVTTTPQFPRRLIGSDTLNRVMDETLFVLGLRAAINAPEDDPTFNPNGYNTYYGIGSTSGELQLEGNPAPGEPTCLPTVTDGGNNPGCQEISPMSRALDSSICNDEEATGQAEGLAIAKDGLVVLTDNATHQRFKAGSCTVAQTPNSPGAPGSPPSFADTGSGYTRRSGTLPSGYVIGGGLLTPSTAWKDVLRIIYFGFDNDDNWGTPNGANSGSVLLPRIPRCTSALRQEVLSNLNHVFYGTSLPGQDSADPPVSVADCAAGTCSTGIRQVYRRDDASGTTQVFAEILGVRWNTGTNAGRSTLINAGFGGTISADNDSFAFCDGGQYSGFWPVAGSTVGNVSINGDPIRKPCAIEDDLCGANGQIGVVRAIKTPLGGEAGAYNWPTAQCTRGRFARVPWISVSGVNYPVCPNGTAPVAGNCYLPYYAPPTGPINFNCLNDRTSRAPGDPGTLDGRVYNWVIRQPQPDASGRVVQRVGGGFLATGVPDVAQWRQNMANLDTGFTGSGGKVFTAADVQCQLADATRLVGCLVSRTTCTLGYAGRESAYASGETYHLTQEPIRLKGSTSFVGPTDPDIISTAYPFARTLYINAIGGFEHITSQCLARGGSTKQCQDQVTISNAFYNIQPNDAIWNIIASAGFIPQAPVCEGTQASAGCGAPTVQPLTACQPL